jgi:hypothetical protein
MEMVAIAEISRLTALYEMIYSDYESYQVEDEMGRAFNTHRRD